MAYYYVSKLTGCNRLLIVIKNIVYEGDVAMFQEITINNNMEVHTTLKPPTKCIIPLSYELTGHKFSISRAGTVSTEDGDLDVVLMLSNGTSQLLTLDYLSKMLEMLEHFSNQLQKSFNGVRK